MLIVASVNKTSEDEIDNDMFSYLSLIFEAKHVSETESN